METKRKTISLYRLSGNKPGKKFNEVEYWELCKDHKPSGTKYSFTLNSGEVVKTDSRQEISVIRKLQYHNAFKYLNTQCLKIPYRYGGKDHFYYPDFVLYTNTHKIVIVEVKMISEMQSRINLKKFDALRRFSQRNGYLYVVIDKHLKSLANLSEYNVSFKVQASIEEALNKNKCFKYVDYQNLINGCTHKEINKIRDYIGIYIAKHSKTLKQVGDLTFRSKDFRITFIKKNRNKDN